MRTPNDNTIDHIITPSNKDSSWVAIDIIDGNIIIAEGNSPEEVSEKAEKTGKQFMLMFVPKTGETYIF